MSPAKYLESPEGRAAMASLTLIDEWLPKRSRVEGVWEMKAGIAWKMHCGLSEREATAREMQYRISLAMDVDRTCFRSVFPGPIGL